LKLKKKNRKCPWPRRNRRGRGVRVRKMVGQKRGVAREFAFKKCQEPKREEEVLELEI